MPQLFDIDLTEEEFDFLLCEQANGKELKVVEGKVIAEFPVPSEEELLNKNILEKKKRLEELTKDFAQHQAGLIIEDIEERKKEFRTLLNEVRVLEGKEPRKIINEEEITNVTE